MTPEQRFGRDVRSKIAGPSPDWRRAVNDGPRDPAAFDKALSEAGLFGIVESRAGLEAGVLLPHPVRIAFWNAERCKYLTESASLLRDQHAHVTLLAEMDLGMARSDNRHTTRELAMATEQGYVFGVEFVELDLGDARERTWHAGESNTQGLHGAAILSAYDLNDPAVVRLELDGDWFDGRHGERRVGGRIAVVAKLDTVRGPIAVASVHLESHSSPIQRMSQMEALCRALDDYADGAPLVIGGDFNTNSFDQSDGAPTPDNRLALAREDRDRLSDPVSYEPLFDVAREFGLDWTACNAPGPTQRTRPDGTPQPPFGKIDWFFTRGLTAMAPRIVPAVDHLESAISDHELLLVEVDF